MSQQKRFVLYQQSQMHLPFKQHMLFYPELKKPWIRNENFVYKREKNGKVICRDKLRNLHVSHVSHIMLEFFMNLGNSFLVCLWMHVIMYVCMQYIEGILSQCTNTIILYLQSYLTQFVDQLLRKCLTLGNGKLQKNVAWNMVTRPTLQNAFLWLCTRT